MVITCPQCSARYKVKDGLIGEKGKKVKCKKCEAVFIAYPDNRSVLREARAPIAPEPSHGPQPPMKEPPQATVKVDRSKLADYLKKSQQQRQAEETPVAKIPQAAASEVQATIQVDRSQIDAFLRKNQDAGPREEAVPSDVTVQVDREAIDAFLKQGSADSPSAQSADPQSGQVIEEAPTVRVSETAAVGPNFAHTDPEVDVSPDDLPPDLNFDEFDNASSPSFENRPTASDPFGDDLSFPSDSELGIEKNEEAFSGSDPVSEFEASLAETSADAMSASDDNDLSDSFPSFEADIAPESDHSDIDRPLPPSEKIYSARVDGKIYPDLNLHAIGRWIEEGRLLESDQVEGGDGKYHGADSFPEIQPYFIRFYEMNQDTQTGAPPKKGFFGRIFSIFKRS